MVMQEYTGLETMACTTETLSQLSHLIDEELFSNKPLDDGRLCMLLHAYEQANKDDQDGYPYTEWTI